EPSFFGATRDDDDIRRAGIAKSLRKGCTDHTRAEVLIFEIHEMPCATDRVDVEMAYFLDRLSRDVSRIGARDGDVDVRDIGRDVARPRIVARFLVDPAGPTPSRAHPAVAAQLSEGARRGAVDDSLHVVVRTVRVAFRIAAVRLVAAGWWGVPAAVRQIETAHESDRVVDDDDLLMVRGAHRVLVVQPEA